MKALELFIARRKLAGLETSGLKTGSRLAESGVRRRPVLRLAALFAAAANMGGCAAHGAPSYTLFGAYFPAWLFCAAIGLLAAVVGRAIFEATGLAYVLPYQLFVCVAIGVCAGLGAFLWWFGA